MPESTIDSSPAGLRVLADVAAILAAGLVTEDALARVIMVLRRGLELSDARIWLRRSGGTGYDPIPKPLGDYAATFQPTTDWFRGDLERDRIAGGGFRLRFPLVFETQGLGAL